MGFREQNLLNWKNSVVEFQGENIFVTEQVEYEGTTYLYGAIERTIHTDNIEVCFLYKVEGDQYNWVQDEEKFNELLALAGGKMAIEKLKKIIK